MTCDTSQRRIVEHLDQQLTPAHDSALAAHLAQCQHCTAWAERLAELDAALTRATGTLKLSPDFCARLHERIVAQAPRLSEAQRLERERQLQAELEARLIDLRRSSFGPAVWIEAVGGIFLALAGAVVLFKATAPGIERLIFETQASREFGVLLFVSLVASAIFLLVGLTTAFQRRLRDFPACF